MPDGKARYAIVQAEDELASIGIVIGAAWNGARAFTCTSGPGISLMSEFIGLAYFAEIPAVIIDVQRAGPSTGMPTRTQQADVLACAYASHGDTKHPLLFPEDPKEGFEMAALALDLADRLQTPVFVLYDLDIGMNERLCDPLVWDDARQYDRGKVLSHDDLEAASASALPRPRRRRHHLAHLSRRAPEARVVLHARNQQRPLCALHGGGERLRGQHAAPPEEIRDRQGPGAEARPAQGGEGLALRRDLLRVRPRPRWTRRSEILESESMHVDALRVRGFPFQDEVVDFVNAHEHTFVVEQNRDAQLRTLLVAERCSHPRSSPRCCTTTARRSPRGSSRARSRSASKRSTSRR
jgi:2-oxoglutarate ferredoxin oxidoreductase subunit alpha